MNLERRVIDACPMRLPGREHDYRAQRQEDGTYRAVCDYCQHDAGTVDTSALDVIRGVGYFREEPEK